MKLETFIEKFDQFADAPNAVEKMRELVLNLAVTGRLSEPRPDDVPVNELVEALLIGKSRRFKNGRRSAVSLPSAIDRPILAPAHWAWIPLNEIGSLSGGMTPSKDESTFWNGDVNWFSSKDIKADELTESELKITREATESTGLQIYAPGCLVIVARSGILKRTFPVSILRAEGTVNQDLKVLSPFVGGLERYLQIMLRGMTAFILTALVKTGMTVQSLKYDEFEAQPFPLPPLGEQKRIVAKVDELMALCDRLDTQYQEREARRSALTRASLARFAKAPTPANLNFLFHKSYVVPPADIRKSILTLAVQGKLIPKDVRPKMASLESILAVASINGVSKGPTLDTSATEILRISAGTSRGDFYVDEDDFKYVDLSSNEIEKFRLTPGDLLACRFNGNLRYVGRFSYYRGESGRTQVNPDKLIRFRVDTTHNCPRYVCYAMNAAPTRKAIEAMCATTAGNIGLSAGRLKTVKIPLPSLTEQRRIVAKVDELMVLVDALETQLATARSTATALLEAAVLELTGAKRISHRTTYMKAKANGSREKRSTAESLVSSTKRFVLHRFAMASDYRSLGAFDCLFHTEPEGEREASPICLVGVNGSGKSNLIEAIAEVFCFLELINLPWKPLRSQSSRYRENRHQFELEYSIEDARGSHRVRIRKRKKSGAEFFIVNDGLEEAVESGVPQLQLLPRRIIGYSSGLNETVSHPFLRTKTLYSQEVRDAAPPEGAPSTEDNTVFDTRTLYMDYESNAAIIICNYIFHSPEELSVFDKFARVCAVSSFGLRFNRKRAGRAGKHKIVRLTAELRSYLQSFASIASIAYDDRQIEYNLSFQLNSKTTAAFRKEFKTAENLFMAMHKWSLLNALILSDEQRNVYLSSDITKGALERPPSVPPSDRVFNIVDLKLKLTQPAKEIDYSGLSDGEHQLIQVFGTALLFSEPGILFLFDEPESHFNPEWRTKFNLILNQMPNASRQEYVVSTHSPYIVSGSRQGNVYKFERVGGNVAFAAADFETYGASFDDLLKKLFSVTSTIDLSAREKMGEIIKRDNKDEMKEAISEFAESKEKRRLYEAIVRKEGAK